MIDLDEILIHAREHGEALLYTPPAEGEPAGFELVAYRPRRGVLRLTEPPRAAKPSHTSNLQLP